MTDHELLRRYVENGSEAAFARVVELHMKLVYWTCRREVTDPQLAEDVTQVVFLLLARKAGSMGKDVSLPGWLFNTARLASRNALRREATRQRGENQVAMMIEQEARTGHEWDSIEPWLNDGIAALSSTDRDAILMRFFDGLTFPELAGTLGVTEDAARMRTGRAIDKLRGFLRRKEVTVTSAVLGALLAERAVDAVPATCAAAVLKIGSLAGHSAQAAAGSSHAAVHHAVGRLVAAGARHKLAYVAAGLVASAVVLSVPHPRAHQRAPMSAVPQAAPTVVVAAISLPSKPAVSSQVDLSDLPDPFKSDRVVIKSRDTGDGGLLYGPPARVASDPAAGHLSGGPTRELWTYGAIMPAASDNGRGHGNTGIQSLRINDMLQTGGPIVEVKPGQPFAGGRIVSMTSHRVTIRTPQGETAVVEIVPWPHTQAAAGVNAHKNGSAGIKANPLDIRPTPTGQAQAPANERTPAVDTSANEATLPPATSGPVPETAIAPSAGAATIILTTGATDSATVPSQSGTTPSLPQERSAK